MSQFVADVFTAVTVGSVLVSALSGVMVGAFYGYMLEPEAPPRYPLALWTVGLVFITAVGAWSQFSADAINPAFSVARAILWTVLCAAIPIGRLARHILQPAVRSRHYKQGLLETDIEREDRQVGDTRRELQEHNGTAPPVDRES